MHGMEEVAGQRGDEGRAGAGGVGGVMAGRDSKKQRGVFFCRAGPWAAACSHTCLLDNGTPSVDFRALFGKQDVIGNRPWTRSTQALCTVGDSQWAHPLPP